MENMLVKKGFLKETILHFGSTSSETVPRCIPAKIILYRSDFKQIFVVFSICSAQVLC